MTLLRQRCDIFGEVRMIYHDMGIEWKCCLNLLAKIGSITEKLSKIRHN